MTKSKLKREELAKKVEQLGVFFEQFDYTPTSARIISYLLLVEPNYQDFDSIRDFLQASKSTISTTLNTLTSKGIVDYMTLPGDRKRYFKVNPNNWLNITKKSLSSVTALESKLADVLEFRDKNQAPEFYNGLRNLQEFFLHLDKYLIKAVEDWEKKEK